MRPTERLKHYLETLATDPEKSFDLVADDVVWINMVPENVPWGGHCQGKEAVLRDYFEPLTESFVIGEHPADEFEFIESGNTVVMVGYEKDCKVLTTGKVFDLHFAWVVRFNDEGKISYLREYNDTAALGEAYRA